jgi:uncharacterized protein
MINIKKKHFDILMKILAKTKIKFYVFGSRSKNLNREFSDLDICYKEPLDPKILVNIKTDLEESKLPYKVDLVDYNSCTDDFKKLIDNDLIELKESELNNLK